MFENISSTEWAYTAGLLDGEGGVSVRLMPTGAINTRVYITGTNRQVLEWLSSRFGGNINHSPDKRVRKNPTKNCYRWELPTKSQATFLQNLLPYLIIKKYRAELVIKARSTVGKLSAGRVEDGIRAQREMWVEEMALLNKFGSC